jgi:hypothetical protein
MSWHTYEVPPVDIGWENLRTVQETERFLAAKAQGAGQGSNAAAADLRSFLAAWESAKDAATSEGWEGDLRNEPVVFWVPDDAEFTFGFVLKQDNNGTTYVVSPVPMPWLEE